MRTSYSKRAGEDRDTAAVADPRGARMAPLSAERPGRRGARGERALCDRPAAAGRRRAVAAHSPAPPDLAAEGFAVRFARSYLTWNAAEPQAHEDALGAVRRARDRPRRGAAAARRAASSAWSGPKSCRSANRCAAGEHVYTVAAQTDDAGLLYLTVSVVRTADGSLALGGYPAFVGAPATGPAQTGAGAPARSRRTGARDGRRARPAQLPRRLGLGARRGPDARARTSRCRRRR